MIKEDGDSYHTTNMTQDLLDGNNIIKTPWPIESPVINPAEHIYYVMDRSLLKKNKDTS